MRDKAADALIAAAIKAVEELQGLVVMLENVNVDDGTKLVSKLREVANLFDRLPLLANDLVTIKKRLRKMLTIDPDATPRPVSLSDLAATSLPPEREKFTPIVEEPFRRETRPGIGIPLPKKDS